ncbi:MAG: hypothetical protein M3308_06805 [Actinomycetota bacterium]|nr:hypothetical protein [Actinomycetota bacterium]
MLALVVLLSPLVTTLGGYTQPTDGWTHTTTLETQSYRLTTNLTGQPSPLQAGDRIIAINGQPVPYASRVPRLTTLQVGQMVHYTIGRDEQTVEVDVPLVQRSPLGVLRHLVHDTQQDFKATLMPLLTLLIVAFAFARRPGAQAARLLLLIFSFYAGSTWFGFADWSLYSYSYPLPLAFPIMFTSFGWAWLFFPALIQLALVFPVRLWPMRRFPRLLPTLLHGAPAVLMLVTAGLVVSGQENAIGPYSVTLVGLLGLFVLTLLASLIANFRTVRDPVVRAQLHWLALGMGVGWGGSLTLVLLSLFLPTLHPLTDAVGGWLAALLPLSLTIAITRYRLFDIAIIIHRALVYGSLTGLLLAVYFGSVVLLQAGFRALTSQGSDLAIIISTLVSAALFQPLRQGLQHGIDRHFYRRKYDATTTLAAFSAQLRNEVDLPTLTDELVAVVQETMQPAHVSLWIRPAAVAPRPNYRSEGE